MKIFVSADRHSSGKFQEMVRAFPKAWDGKVLDVGCRGGQLKNALPKATLNYCGVDLSPPANVVGDLNAGLPFDAASTDIVVALDVLEHTDDIHGSFSELCRVARRHVLIALPNLYEVGYRVRFLRGQRPSGKYGLPTEPPRDQHRWLFSFHDAREFTHAMADRCGFDVADEGCLVGPRRSLLGVRHMVTRFPNLLAPWYVALLQRKEAVCGGN